MPKNFGMPGNAWRYALGSDYGYCSPLLDGIEFENEWVTIRESAIRIRAGYAWDGCSPCISVLGLFYVGTPDGAQHLGLPATYHASLVHDVLCQWRAEIPVTRARSIALPRRPASIARKCTRARRSATTTCSTPTRRSGWSATWRGSGRRRR